eukprot:7722983-Lingulodinium_polyedra.AAC.1
MEKKRLMGLFQGAIDRSQQREQQVSQEFYELNKKHEEELTEFHARLEASEKTSLQRFEQLA